MDVPGLVREAKGKSRAECRRIDLMKKSVGRRFKLECVTKEIVLGAAHDTAAYEARYYVFALLPWASEMIAAGDMAQTVVFGNCDLRFWQVCLKDCGFQCCFRIEKTVDDVSLPANGAFEPYRLRNGVRDRAVFANVGVQKAEPLVTLVRIDDEFIID